MLRWVKGISLGSAVVPELRRMNAGRPVPAAHPVQAVPRPASRAAAPASRLHRLGADQWQAVAFGGASPLLVAIAGNQQRIERKLLEELVQLGRAEARIEQYGDRRTGDGDDGDRGLRRFRQHHTDARIAAETGLAQLPAGLLDHLLQAAVIQRCVARGSTAGCSGTQLASWANAAYRVVTSALTESESGAGKTDPDWGTAASKSWFTAVFPWLGSGLAMARMQT